MRCQKKSPMGPKAQWGFFLEEFSDVMAEMIESIDIFFLKKTRTIDATLLILFMKHYSKEHVSMTSSNTLLIPQDEIVRNIFKNSLFRKSFY